MKKLLFACLLMVAQSGYSADLTEVRISGEKIKNCNLTTESVSAALGATMRYNRINLTESYSGVVLYHAVAASNISGGCAAYITVEFKVYDFVFVKNLNKKIMTGAVLCGQGTLLTGPTYDMQTRVNDSAKDMAQQCLLEISKQ